MDRKLDGTFSTDGDTALDIDALLHPARAFNHPDDVVQDPHLSLYEKRAILSSWASDACAVEAAPALRAIPGSAYTVSFDDVMDALRSLDDELEERTTGQRRKERKPRTKRRPAIGRFSRRGYSGDGDLGSPQIL